MTTTQEDEAGRHVSNYTGFKRDVMYAIAALGGTPDVDVEMRPYGLGIKRKVESYRGVEVNHGRLYPNLDDLVEDGVVKVDSHDKRTNAYALTEAGVDALLSYHDAIVDEAIDAIEPDVATDGGQVLPSGVTAKPNGDDVTLMIPTSDPHAERRGIILSRDEALEAAQDIIDAVDETIPDNIEAIARVAEEASKAAEDLAEDGGNE